MSIKFISASRSLLLSICSYVLLPNLLARVAAHFLFIHRPLLNLDYLLLGIVAPFLNRWLTGLLFGFLAFTEIVVNIAPIYHFTLPDVLHWGWSIVYLSLQHTLPLALVGLSVLALLAITVARPQPRPADRLRLTLTFAIFSLLVWLAPARITYSAFGEGVAEVLATKNQAWSGGPYAQLPPQGSATGPLLNALAHNRPLPPTRIALIVVESMGQAVDPALGESILAPFNSPLLKARYDMSFAAIPFHGYTFAGEFRELCGVELLTEHQVSTPKCLPAYLRERGYQTTAFHGFAGGFYSRRHWYPLVGFARSFFAEELRAEGVKEICGDMFQGICDRAVAQLVHRQLLQSKPQFVYWMTLNSHLPLGDTVGQESHFDCAGNTLTQASPGLCRLTRAVYVVLENVAAIAADPKLPPTEFIIVGDHSPPFLGNFEEGQYSQTEVPAIILRPK